MPPHCDSLDGPVVRAAKRALDCGDVELVLPYVPADDESEIVDSFELTRAVRVSGPEARRLADTAFFETVVRLHRAGEGAPYTGLRPAGLDVGPVIPVAERAVETGSATELASLLTEALRHEIDRRFRRIVDLASENGNVATRRAHVDATLGLQVWAHALYEAIHAHPHEHEHAQAHAHER